MSCLNLIDSDDSAILNLFSRNKSSLKMEQFVVFKSTVCTASTRKFKDVSVLSIVSAAARFFLENGHWVLIFWIFVDVKEEENHLAKSGKNRKKVQFLEPPTVHVHTGYVCPCGFFLDKIASHHAG